MIKAVFFDIDGTLISFKTHRLPQATLEALVKLKEKGVKVFIATGRAEMLIKNIDTTLFDGVITVNGQRVRSGGEVIYEKFIPKEDIRNAVRFVEEKGITCLFEGIDFLAVNEINESAVKSIKMIDIDLPRPGNIRDVVDKGIIQMIFFGNPEQEAELLGGMPGAESTRWTDLFTDIIARGGGKHVGLAKTLAHLGIKQEESMAFGDGDNDISMIRYAGIGVAMGNAADSVKDAADFVTSSVDDEGVPAALRHFGLI